MIMKPLLMSDLATIG